MVSLPLDAGTTTGCCLKDMMGNLVATKARREREREILQAQDSSSTSQGTKSFAPNPSSQDSPSARGLPSDIWNLKDAICCNCPDSKGCISIGD